jgi:hypothetical protein
MARRLVGHRYRKRTPTPIITVPHMVLAALWPEESFQASVGMWQHLHRAVVATVCEVSERWAHWRGPRVVSVDGTCLTLDDQPALRKQFGRQRGHHGTSRYPLMRLVTVSLANTMTVLGYAFGSYRTSETALLRRLFDSLSPGDLIVTDRHYAGQTCIASISGRGWSSSRGPISG